MKLRWKRAALLLVLAVLIAACGADEAEPEAPPNLLIIVIDDVGMERVGFYSGAPLAERTPNIDRLGREGIAFDNFWAMPACSPSRAALITGRLPRRTGIGTALNHKPHGVKARGFDYDDDYGLPDDADSLARAAASVGYASAVAGKWHLGSSGQGFEHPLRLGFDHHHGPFGNIRPPTMTYSNWVKLVDGTPTNSQTYATTDTTDEAIALASTLTEPWLIVVSFNAAHKPIHSPPAELYSRVEKAADPASEKDLFRAMVEAMDTEIGRLLANVAPFDPFIFLLSDNGTSRPGQSARDKGRGKSTLYENNLRVPFIVKHSSIVSPGRRVAGLASITDLFATVAELSGAAARGYPASPDSVSLTPYFGSDRDQDVRDSVVAERFWPNGPGPYRLQHSAARDRRYKVVRKKGVASDRLFDLTTDPGEDAPVRAASLEGEAREAYTRLARLLEDDPAARRR